MCWTYAIIFKSGSRKNKENSIKTKIPSGSQNFKTFFNYYDSMMLDVRNLTLEQIKNILGLEDNRSAIKWLNDNGITLAQIGRKYVVNQFLFEFKQQQIAVEELKISYPNCWFEIYDANTPDKGMVQAIAELYPRKKLVKVKNNKENSLIK